MDRLRNSDRNAGALTVPLAMVDVWLLLLIVTIVQAVFNVGKVPLPNFDPVDPSPGSSQAERGVQVTLESSGVVTWEGEPIELDNVATRVGNEVGRQIELSIETDAEGRGASQALMQLLLDLSDAGVGDRVQVLYTETPNDR